MKQWYASVFWSFTLILNCIKLQMFWLNASNGVTFFVNGSSQLGRYYMELNGVGLRLGTQCWTVGFRWTESFESVFDLNSPRRLCAFSLTISPFHRKTEAKRKERSFKDDFLPCFLLSTVQDVKCVSYYPQFSVVILACYDS